MNNPESNEQLITDDGIQASSLLDIDTKQKISLQGNDNSNTYTLYSNECDIFASKNSSEPRINASNKIKVNRLVNYEWEQRYNNGNLIAVHKSGQYFAYSIRVDNNGKVRIFHKKLNEKVLLKSFKGRVVDLSFAHSDSDVLLGCVDETGCLQIFKITLDTESKIQTNLILNINGNLSGNNTPDPTTHRIIWCLYVPEPVEESNQNQVQLDDASRTFVLTRRNQADIFNLDILQQNYDCSQALNSNELTQGHLVINEHKSTILTANFSPDGSAIATASFNGEVCFFKLSFSNSDDKQNTSQLEDDKSETSSVNRQSELISPKCLKIWKPHENKPINSLYFLDDHKNTSADAQFWSFILTGADYNREIKIWSCLKWECLQTINFYPTPFDDLILSSPNKLQQSQLPCFKTAIDLTSRYLVMSDVTRKCFYVLHLYQDYDSYVSRCTAISEYILAYPAVSFAIIDSQQIKAKKYNQLNNLTTGSNSNNQTQSTVSNLADDVSNLEANNTDLINTSLSSTQSGLNPSIPQLTNDQDHLVTMIRLYCIQTKQLQEMHIFLTGEQTISSFNSNSVSPPPPMLHIRSTNSSLSQSTSLLQQLLPNNQSKNKLLTQSISLSSDIKNRLSESEYDSKENKVNPVNKSISNHETTLNKFTEDSAIIQIVTPPIGINTLSAPILMTPDAFINSPSNNNNTSHNSNNNRKSNEPVQQKLDILQNFLNNSLNSNNSQSINLLSSRTSSLTQVTNQTQLVSQIVNEPKQNNSLTKLNTNGSNKNLRRRNLSSSSSSSSSTSSSSCSSCSETDQADKEIAALSSRKKLEIKNSNIEQNVNKTELLLNKVSIEDDVSQKLNESDSTLIKQSELLDNQNLNQDQEIKLELNQNWPNPPTEQADSDLKNVLIQMTQAIKAQNEQIEALKKQQIQSQTQFRSQLEQLSKYQQQQPSVQIQTDDQKIELVLQQTINNNLLPKMDKLIKEEISKSVQTQLTQRLLDPLREQLSRDLADKIKSIENVLKDNVSKLFKSKSTIDTMSQSISNSMQGVIVNSYRETFQKLIVPNFEKSCQNMYQQVNSSFAKGTQDYLAEFDQLAKQQKKLFDEHKEPILSQIKIYTDQMHAHGKQVASEMATNLQIQFDNHLRNTNAILQDTIISSVKAIIKEEIQHAMRDQQHILPDRLINYMRQSGTLTPVNLPLVHSSSNMTSINLNQSSQDTMTQIKNFVNKKQLNSAFQVALCAADLNQLMTLCQMVTPNEVFELTINSATKKPQCQLQQPVILSLIQQLSQDLNTNIELKVKYLEEAIVNLDMNNALTQEHSPTVISQSIMKIQQYIQMHPNDKMVKSLRMILMASQSLLNQPKHSKSTPHHDTF